VDIQEYISTGVIEAYVLGIATDEEVRELERMSSQHPEIAAAIVSYRKDLDDYSLMHSIKPPAHLKEEIWEALNAAEHEPKTVAFTPTAAANIDRTENYTPPRPRFQYVALAATVLLLIGSLLLNFVFWNQHNNTERTLSKLQLEQTKFMAAHEKMQQQLDSSNRNLGLLLSPAVKSIALAGVGTHLTNSATLLWDTRTTDVYVSLNNLPPAPTGKQYQIWAIVAGKPVNLGIYSNEHRGALQKMNAIPAAEMFAITLEKEGGSENPTLEEMYVAGKV